MNENTPAQLRMEAERLTREAEAIEADAAREALAATSKAPQSWTMTDIEAFANENNLTCTGVFMALTTVGGTK